MALLGIDCCYVGKGEEVSGIEELEERQEVAAR